MGQGLARAEAATSAAASCLRRRRRRAIGAIVVCGPFLGCPSHECGQRSAPDLLPAIEMRRETGAEFGFGGLREIVPRFRRTSWSQSVDRATRIARGRLWSCGRRFAAFSVSHCSASGTQSQQHILIIRTSFELGSDACKLETTPAAQA